MAGLTGKIFDLSGKVGGARTAHPHVVAVEVGNDCLLLPAYTSGGHEIEQYKHYLFRALGLRPDQAYVELDNAVHVRFYDGRKGNLATWVVERVDRWPSMELAARRPAGEMDDAGLHKILITFGVLIKALPDRFSASVRKRVRQLTADVAARRAAPPPTPTGGAAPESPP